MSGSVFLLLAPLQVLASYPSDINNHRGDSSAVRDATSWMERRALPCPAFPGYLAEVEVTVRGSKRHGRLIVTPAGRIHLEHLDRATVRGCLEILQPASTSAGWNDLPRRLRVQRRFCCLRWKGRQWNVLTEAKWTEPNAEGSLKVLRLRVLGAR